MRIVADYTKCVSIGMCEAEAPDVFEIQDDGSMKMLTEHPTAEQLAAVREAVRRCPNQVLTLVED